MYTCIQKIHFLLAKAFKSTPTQLADETLNHLQQASRPATVSSRPRQPQLQSSTSASWLHLAHRTDDRNFI